MERVTEGGDTFRVALGNGVLVLLEDSLEFGDLLGGDVLRGPGSQFTGQLRLSPEEVTHVLLRERGGHDEASTGGANSTKPSLRSVRSPSRTGVVLTPTASAIRSMRRKSPARTSPEMIISRTYEATSSGSCCRLDLSCNGIEGCTFLDTKLDIIYHQSSVVAIL